MQQRRCRSSNPGGAALRWRNASAQLRNPPVALLPQVQQLALLPQVQQLALLWLRLLLPQGLLRLVQLAGLRVVVVGLLQRFPPAMLLRLVLALLLLWVQPRGA